MFKLVAIPRPGILLTTSASRVASSLRISNLISSLRSHSHAPSSTNTQAMRRMLDLPSEPSATRRR